MFLPRSAPLCWFPVMAQVIRMRLCVQIIAFTRVIRTLVKMVRIANTGWRRPIGCRKSRVIFRNRATDYRALLRKLTHKVFATLYWFTVLPKVTRTFVKVIRAISKYIYSRV